MIERDPVTKLYVVPERNCYVYALLHVEENKVFYIGRGTLHKGRFDRYSSHVSEARKGGSLHVYRKMRKLWETKQTISFQLRGTGLTLAEAETMEERLVAAIGLDNLCNETPGGKDIRFLSTVEQAAVRIIPPRTKEQILNHRRGAVNKQEVYVQAIDTGVITRYDSMHDAARATRSSATSVWHALHDLRRRRGKVVSYNWRVAFSQEELAKSN